MKKIKLLATLISSALFFSSITVVSVSADNVTKFDTGKPINLMTGMGRDDCWQGHIIFIDTRPGAVSELYTTYQKGDIDMDGVLTEHDIILFTHAFYVPKTEPDPFDEENILQNINGFFYGVNWNEMVKDEYTIFNQIYLADMNENGRIDLYDLELLKESVKYKAGDVNQDGEVTVDDASLILTEYAKKSAGLEETFTEEQKNLADMNGKLFKTNADKVDSATVDNASSVLERYARQAAGLPAIEGDSVLADYLG